VKILQKVALLACFLS